MKARLLIALATVLFASPLVLACPFCAAPSLTLSEQLTQADAAVLVQWVDATAPTEKSPGSTQYVVVQVAHAGKEKLKKDDKIVVPRYRAGKKGDLFLLFGTKDSEIDWGSPLEVTEATYQYIVQAPSPEAPTTKRLEYFLKFLEYPDQLVSNDAYGEFANAPYEDIVKIRDKMDREKISKWVASKDTSPTRLGLYGLLLGLCGNDSDAEMMLKRIEEPTEDFRLGIDGLISGYLLLTGNKGLDRIDRSKLQDKKAPFSETYAAMQALRFMWTYGNGRISQDRLRQSMRELLDRPELADLVIADLARWEDWSVQDRLMKLYDKEDYSIPSIKRAIVRYLLTAAKMPPPKTAGADDTSSTAKTSPVEVSPATLQARANLEKLRELDPKTVKEAERFFFLQ
jgi:hypothetical protein